MTNTIERQIEIMERQLGHFDSVMEKMQYLSMFFDLDPDFSQEARDTVRSHICQSLPKE